MTLIQCIFSIAQKLEGKKIIDIANSNNNLSDKVSDYYKTHISEHCIRI